MSPKKAENLKYIKLLSAQASKTGKLVCGDVFLSERTVEATTVILCDGVGSGIKANLAATMCAGRIKELLRLDFSLRDVCAKVVNTMHKARTEDIPFSAFSIARVRKDGYTTVVTYEMPAPVFIQNSVAYVSKPRFITLGSEVVGELQFMIQPDDAILLVSDGISQAGMGQTFKLGWTVEKACAYINSCLNNGFRLKDVPDELINYCRKVSCNSLGDDTSVAVLQCRDAAQIHVLTGPAADRDKDTETVNEFSRQDGVKVVCGSTTAEICGRVLGRQVRIRELSQAYYQPPQYEIDGFDLVTEGAITLNQVYNIIDTQDQCVNASSSVFAFRDKLLEADYIDFWVGAAVNDGHEDVIFRQMHILPRRKVVDALADKLRVIGKLVTVRMI